MKSSFNELSKEPKFLENEKGTSTKRVVESSQPVFQHVPSPRFSWSSRRQGHRRARSQWRECANVMAVWVSMGGCYLEEPLEGLRCDGDRRF